MRWSRRETALVLTLQHSSIAVLRLALEPSLPIWRQADQAELDGWPGELTYIKTSCKLQSGRFDYRYDLHCS